MTNPKPKRTKSESRSTETEIQKNVLEELPIGICHIDLKGTFKYVNKCFEEVTGYSRDEVVGKNALKMDLFPDDMRSYILKRIAARIGGAPSKKWDTQFKCRDGSRIWVTMEGTIIRKSGIPVGFQIVASDITKRKRAEEALRESELKYRRVSDNSPDVIFQFIMAPDGTFSFSYVSDAVTAIIGVSPEDVLKDPLALLGTIHPEDQAIFQDSIMKSAESLEFLPITFRCMKGGEVIWIEARGMPAHMTDGRILWDGFFIDITDRKRAEEALRALSTRQQAILTAVPDIIIEVDKDKVYTWTNSAGLKFFGEDVIGKEAAFYFEGEQSTYDQLHPLFDGERDIDYVESWQRRKDGEKRLLAWWCRVLKDADGNVTGALSTAHDITDRKQTEEALSQERALLNTLMENIPDHIYFKDINSRFIKISTSHAKIFNMDNPVQAMGKTDFDFFMKEHAQAAFDTEQEIIMTGRPVVGIEEKETWPDGHNSWVSTTKVPMRDESGNIIGTVGISRDITERKQAEEALQESEAKYRLMVESSRDAIVISQNDRFIFINDAFASMLGYQKDDLFMCSYTIVFTEKAVSLLEERSRQRDAGIAVPDRYETVFKKKDGSKIPVEANVRIIDYKEKKATFAVIRDITKQKKITAALQESAEQSEHLKNLIPICAGCNKIRDDERELHPWVSPAVYINDRLTNVQFSHGMCPDCMKKWYPEYVAEKSESVKNE